MEFKKLYIITGKGGVGKTMTAMALTKCLQEQTSKKVVYNSFDEPADASLCDSLGISYLDLPLTQSTTEYVSRKLGSRSIAKWIMKAPFFKALFNMVPGLGNMITLGHLLDILKKSDDQIIVVDAPSSGHLLTILESPTNFKEIFKSGTLVHDIHQMLDILHNPQKVETWVLSIPTELAVTEGFELKEKLNEFGLNNTKAILNNALSTNGALKHESLPDFLQNKLKIEQDIIALHKEKYDLIIPMFIDKNPLSLVKSVQEKLAKFINKM